MGHVTTPAIRSMPRATTTERPLDAARPTVAEPARVASSPSLAPSRPSVPTTRPAAIDAPRVSPGPLSPGQHVSQRPASESTADRVVNTIRHAAQNNGSCTEGGVEVGETMGRPLGGAGRVVGAAAGAVIGGTITVAGRAAEFVIIDVIGGAFSAVGSVFD